MNRKPITAIIFTKDNPKKVINLVEILNKYIEEIIVIDSSSKENFLILRKNIENNAKIFNFAPLGYADPFHKIGADLSKNEWILHIDDDEIPNETLMKNLKTESDVAAYLVQRVEKKRDFISEHPRLYNKNSMIFTGLVHFSLIPSGKISKIPGKLIHHENPSSSKWKKYAILDAYAMGYKIRWRADNKKWHPFNNNSSKKAHIFSKLFNLQFVFGKNIGWFLIITEYLITVIIHDLMKGNYKARYDKLIRTLYIYFYALNGYNNMVKVWQELYNEESLNRYLCIESLKDYFKLTKESKKGFNLLMSIIEKRIKNDSS